MTPEEKGAMRRDRDMRVRRAWADLAIDPSFRTIFEEDLQIRFNLHQPSFTPPNFDAHEAALKDGQKAVISYIARKVAAGVAALEVDDTTPPPQSQSQLEFQGTPP